MEEVEGEMPPVPLSILDLPSELILQCLYLLAPTDLAALASTCRILSKAAQTESLWQNQVTSNLHDLSLASPAPFASFKDLYLAHHPYWFLPRHRVWISDAPAYGALALSRYNPESGTVEAFSVVAERGEHTITEWSHDRNVLIHGFQPKIKLHSDQPVLKLAYGNPRIEETTQAPARGLFEGFFSPRPPVKLPRLSQEILMDCTHKGSPGHKTSFALSRDLPEDYITPGTAAWPPLLLPAPARTRNLSVSDFSATSHRPRTLNEVSESTFRVRRWLDFRNRTTGPRIAHMTASDRRGAARGLSWNDMEAQPTGSQSYERRSEHVSTFGTMDPKSYTPTAKKPWRGIYCGDFSGHGCEFLIILQPDEGEEGDLPEGLNWLKEWLVGGRLEDSNQARGELGAHTILRMNEILMNMAERDGFRRRRPIIINDGEAEIQIDIEEEDEESEPEDDWHEPEGTRGDIGRQTGVEADDPALADPSDIYTGRLVAIKLTGDPHVPRGEITFIAPDIGEKGYVRTAQEEVFQGARVVRSAGHVANSGFMYDEYIPSELIMVSHDCLAQYWKGFGHISFYKRVDIDALLRDGELDPLVV